MASLTLTPPSVRRRVSQDANPFTSLDHSLLEYARERSQTLIAHKMLGNGLAVAGMTRLPESEGLVLASSPDDVSALPPISREDIEAHRGEWVLLRAGRVVDHADDPDILLQEHRLSLGDLTLYLVPTTDRRFH